jgi:hypothetical protein
MDDNSVESIERHLANVSSLPVPTELREDVLRSVHRELAAAYWDRRLARAAALLLVVGVGMNVMMALSAGRSSGAGRQLAEGPSRASLAQVAATVAEATDAATGSRYARQLAAMSGLSLTSEQSAAIEAAVKLHARPAAANGKDG